MIVASHGTDKTSVITALWSFAVAYGLMRSVGECNADRYNTRLAARIQSVSAIA